MEKPKKSTAKLIGKVCKLPKNYDAIKFMENVKIPRNKLWYVLVEKQKTEAPNSEELHMIKYNQEGVNVNQFMAELKSYYLLKFKEEKNIHTIIEKIQVTGNDKFSVIKNIQNVEIGGEKLISRITKDLIKLLK